MDKMVKAKRKIHFAEEKKMKKDDVIIMTCDVCGAMSHAIKTKISKGYYIKDEFILCKICFGELK